MAKEEAEAAGHLALEKHMTYTNSYRVTPQMPMFSGGFVETCCVSELFGLSSFVLIVFEAGVVACGSCCL